ncbi:metallophosphoesterase [Paenibacillus arenilitoris]|uniref:Serine/threonine protein phosphatase n=1 Tax=Paenibacillus arenilitoris TaxID=2772299 RepID=A0A927CMG2_9BACL|nr:metallophosphoesterase [Paenibacillus arenilitoris]MBD2868300.1 serine/threonine protein phosphatase [Paenibacillus arenilitoris]
MKRTLAISDIHGCYTAFNDLLARMNYKPGEDQLVLLGDFVDRGPRSREVVEQVIRLVRDDGAIAIQGNHDERLVDVMLERSEQALLKFSGHGGRQTAESYAGIRQGAVQHVIERAKAVIHERYPHHLTFLDGLPYYYEDDHFIYVHAGLNPNYSNWREQPSRDFLYMKEPFLSRPTSVDKTVVFGHTKTIDIHGKPDIWFGDGKIGIDGGCASGHQLNGLEITGPGRFRTYAVPWRP